MADQDGSRFGTVVEAPRYTPAQRARTARIQQEPELPPPPAPVGPELSFPLEVTQQPRAGLALNGERADHLLIEMDVTNNRYFEADRFRCELAFVEDDPKFGKQFWDQYAITAEFFVGFGVDEAPSTLILSGRVDDVQVDFDGRTVTLSGRDHTADLIEYRLAEKYPNKTSSEIARILASAAKVGLEADVTDTKTLAGTYYAAEHAQLADETTAWNLLTFLAEKEGFDCYVQGKTLYFGPPPDPISAPRWVCQYESPDEERRFPRAPAGRLRCSRSLTISRDIVVKVVSWNSQRNRSLEGTSRSKLPTRGSSGKFTSAVSYVFRRPNLNQEQADRLAQQLAKDITKDLRSIEITLPGAAEVDIKMVVELKGTGMSFDTKYHLDEITRRMSQGSGFTMSIRGRNIVPEQTAAL